MKASEAAEIVLLLAAAYPAAQATEATSRVYETLLADLDGATARRAVAQLIATSRFFPTVAEIREVTAAFERAEQAKRARQRAARVPSLTRAQLADRDRPRVLSLVPPPPPGSAPVDLVRAIVDELAHARPPVPRDSMRARRWSAAELDAALGEQPQGVV